MSSISAAERMNAIYWQQRHIYDVTRRPYLLGRADLIRELLPPADGHVLEIGCGTGWNLIRAAAHYPHAMLYGLDISSAMLATARRSIARQGLENRIVLAEADATAFDPAALFGRAKFDRIFICYALSMIPAWPQVVARAAAASADSGSIHILDFGDLRALPQGVKRLLYTWLRRFSVDPISDFETRVRDAACTLGLTSRSLLLYRGYAAKSVLSHK